MSLLLRRHSKRRDVLFRLGEKFRKAILFSEYWLQNEVIIRLASKSLNKFKCVNKQT